MVIGEDVCQQMPEEAGGGGEFSDAAGHASVSSSSVSAGIISREKWEKGTCSLFARSPDRGMHEYDLDEG